MEQLGGGSSPERVVELELHHFLVLFRIFGSELLNFPGFEPELPLESAVLLLILLLCQLHVLAEGLALHLEVRYPTCEFSLAFT